MRPLKPLWRLYLLLLLAIPFTVVNGQADNALHLVATTTQAADLAAVLTQDVPAEAIRVTGLMGAGVDPHLYKPTEADIEALNTADMIVYSGLHLEGQFDKVFKALSERGIQIIALSEPVQNAGFVMSALNTGDNQIVTDDPHFWFDPRNWQLATRALAEALTAFDPAHADIYRRNADRYIAQLDLLFAWADAGMRQVPEAQRYLVTSHDAFQYFGAAFGWQMQAIQGISTETEAGVGDIQETVNFVLSNQIPVIFVESSVSPATIEAVQEAVIAAGGSIRLGIRELYSDAMGEPGSFGGTYIGMIASNVLTILQSYQLAGVEIAIPPWPDNLQPAPPDTLLAIDQ